MHGIPHLKNELGRDSIEFEKYHANGNDFIIIDGSSYSSLKTDLVESLKLKARILCDRHRGVGADGIFLLSHEQNFLHMTVINADGSLAKNCGNGLRCVAHWFFRRYPHESTVTIELGNKIYTAKKEGSAFFIEMGLCSLVAQPDYTFSGHAKPSLVFKADVGNPHLVFLSEQEDEPALLISQIKSAFANWQDFNVGLILGKTHRSIVYERGVGFTQSCGSGAIAAAMALFFSGRTEKNTLLISQPGGNVEITLSAISKHTGQFNVSQIADASFVYRGELFF